MSILKAEQSMNWQNLFKENPALSAPVYGN
jgi:hypothetical protein